MWVLDFTIGWLAGRASLREQVTLPFDRVPAGWWQGRRVAED
jgi:hypothetical protein